MRALARGGLRRRFRDMAAVAAAGTGATTTSPPVAVDHLAYAAGR